MTFVDLEGLTTAQAELWREVSELNDEKPEAWLLFVNAGHTLDTAKALHDKGLIDAEMRMGMPACRVRPAIEDSCGCVFCDIGLTPIKTNSGWLHFGLTHRSAPCTNPAKK